MTPPTPLQWIKPAAPVLGNIRVLSDGARTLALLDLIPRAVPTEYRSHPSEWLYTHTTHVIEQPGRTVQLQMPAVALTDGQGHILYQVGILDDGAWARLRGTILPALEEQERTIEFPPLPDHPLW